MPTTITGASGVNQVAPNSIDFVDLKNTLFNGLLGNNGYIKIPVNDQGVNRELVVQWGTGTTVAGNNGKLAVTFPTPFPNAVLAITGSHRGAGGAMFVVDNTQPINANGFTALVSQTLGGTTSSAFGFFYVAIGY